jgi:hypothetical protein
MLAPPAGCRDARHAAGRRRLSSSRRSAASCPLMPPLPFVLYASPPICLLFASWLSRRPCCGAAADSASRLCLDLFFAIWLLQLTTPHLSRRRRLSSSSRLCLATRRLRLSTRRRLITGCVVARRQCAGIFTVIAIAIVALVARRQAGVVDVDMHRHSRRRRIPLHHRHRR